MTEPAPAATSSGESPFAEPRAPRLSIFHLMLWTLCSAGYLALFRARGLPNEIATLHRTSGVVFGVIMGAVLAGAIVLGYDRLRFGPPMLRYPGHWLLVVTAILCLTGSAISFLFIVLGSNGWIVWPIVVYAVVYSFSAVAYFFAARCLFVRRWKLLFLAMAGVSAIDSIFYFCLGLGIQWVWMLSAIATWGSLFLGGWVVVVSILDVVVRGARRDWLHWVGVATYVASAGWSAFSNWLLRF